MVLCTGLHTLSIYAAGQEILGSEERVNGVSRAIGRAMVDPDELFYICNGRRCMPADTHSLAPITIATFVPIPASDFI